MVEFCVVLTSVTNHYMIILACRLYSLTGSTSVSMSMFTLTAIRSIGQTPCSFEHYLVLLDLFNLYLALTFVALFYFRTAGALRVKMSEAFT